jgi:hypothetical protein
MKSVYRKHLLLEVVDPTLLADPTPTLLVLIHLYTRPEPARE